MNLSKSLLSIILNYILIYYLIIIVVLAEDENNQSVNLEQYLVEKINLELIKTNSGSVLNSINNINNIAYYNGYLYVGAQNWLLKLDANSLKLIQNVQYGPVLDSTMCRYYPVEECTFDATSSSPSKKIQMDNHNKLLIIYEQRQAILTCWSAKQGTCDLRDLSDLNRIIQTSNIPTVANDPFNSTIGFIASSANLQDLFYTATTYTSQGPYRDDVPALSGRSLNTQQQQQLQFSYHNSNNRFMQILTSNSQGLKSSKASIEFISRFMRTFVVKYVTAFNLGIYNYFLSVQHQDTDAMLRGDLLVTKLARLCLNDLSFTKSYTEIPLRCIGGGGGTSSTKNDGLRSIDYNELINAKLIQIKSNGFDNSDSNDYYNSEPNYYMIGLFQKTQRNTFNATLPKVNARQAVCLFSMKQLQEKIKENLRKCYDSHSEETSSTTSSKVVMRGLSFIKSDQVCSSARQHHQRGTSSQINDDFCSSADNGLYPIGGQIPAISAPLIEFDESSNINFDTIQAWSDSIATTLVLMSSKRQELRYFHLKSINSVPINYRIVKLNTRQDKENSIIPVTNLQFENIGTSPPNMFVATDKHIYKLKTSTCESYSTCNECLLKSVNINVIDNNSGGGDPYCGWCNQLNECTTRARCIEQQQMQTQNADSIKWINGAQLLNDSLVSLTVLSSMCVDIDTIEPNLISDETEWIQINFRKALPSFNNSQYQCVYLASNSSETITEAIQITNNKLKCSIPHKTKLKQLFESNLFKQVNNNLLLGEDGLFKQSKLQYYEEKSNQLQLPIYIQNSQLKNVRYGAPLTATSNKELKTLFNLTIINCDAHKSCISCLNSNKQCIWCSNSCVSSTTKVEKCQNEQQTCESFDTGSTTKLLIPFTQHRQQAPLTLSLLNQASSSSDQPKYECMFTMFNGEFLGKNVSLPVVYLNKTHIQCVLTNVFKYLSFLIDSPSIETTTPGQIQTNLRLFNSDNNIFIDSISNGKLALLFYKCEIKANDCSQCLSLNRQLSCMWCGSSGNNAAQQQQPSCRFMNSHSKQALNSQCISSLFQKSSSGSFNQCEKPQILDIHPVKLPVGGGTTLIINGINLGTSFEDIIGVSLYCGGGGNMNTATDDSSSITNEFVFKCDLLPNKYIPSKQIGCKTRPINSVQHNCRVSVKLKSNFKSSTTSDLLNSAAIQTIFITGSQQVEYVDPIIHEIQPGLVIQSANFVWLTIKGADLDAGRTRQIQIVDYEQQQQHDSRFVKCEIKNVSSSEIKCRLNDKFKILGKKNVKIIFDEYMTIINYLSIRVTTDPLVSAVDKKLTLYAGGSQFYLEGFNFDAVQTAYTYVAFKDIWYSEPVIVRERISNEKMKFEYPALNEAFFQQQIINNNNKISSSKFELQIGFLMDGFNVTLKETSIIYVPNFDQITIKNIEIINDKTIQNFNLIIDLDSIDLLFLSSMYFNMLRDDLNVYIACSQCTKINWINETRFTCNLPTQSYHQHNRTSSTCDLKVFNSILTQLNLNKLNLLHFFIGNYELKQQILFEETNDNLRIFMKTYQLENIDNYSNLAKQLLQSVNNPNNNLTILNHSLLTLKQQKQSIIQTSLDESTISRNLILISSIIAGLLVLLIIFIIGIVTVILKTKHKYSNNKYDTTGLSLTHNFLRSGHKSASFSKSKRTNNNNSTKSEKKLKLEFERIKKQMEQLEMNARTTCAHLFQQLHQDYVNELNHDMIYTIGLPVWNYKTYLINILFPSSSLSLLNNLLVVNVTNSNLMSNSSMSNSTTNTLVSSNLTPKQQQQQQQSVYATIKSTNMLSLSNDEQFKNHGHVGEAMQLFDQLLHNKTFLLTFIQVCEENSTFTLKDRCHLASLLTICLRDNLPYFYSIVKCLLADYIAQSFSPTHCNNKNMNRSKLLFRSNESLIEPLLTNWISMFMFDFQKDTQCATHLYRLVKVIKFYLDMGPCDEQTQQATNTLNEERLLKEFIQFQPVYVNIVNKLTAATISNTTTVQICRLLDCDTINQAKEKILDHLFKTNRTLAPAINNIDLELCLLIVNQDQQQQTTVITLKDTEEELLMATNQQQQPQLVTTNGLKRLLTLKDYNIQNGAFINICIKQHQQQQQHVYMSTLSMNNEYSIYASNQSQKPPVPPIVSPPPLLTNQSQRFHIVRPSLGPINNNNNNMLLTFSTTTGSTSLASSSSTETTTDSSQFSSTNKKSNNKKKKYEKLLTVKSQDSGVTTTSLISNSETSNNNNNNNSASILTRLLVNKGTLQPFIDQFVDTLFSNTANLPPVIQHLFEFFDQEIKKYSPNIAQTLSNKEKKTNPNCLNDQLNAMTRLWKTNSYFLRYWINIIKNPDFLLDINKNWLIDSSLTSIAQALIDSCSNTDSHNLYDTNSPINRLLFIKEVPRYKQMIDKFYNEMQSYQPISDHELHFYLNEFAKCQQQQHMSQPIGATINHQTTPNTHVNSELSSIQTLLQLYEYYEKYEQQINASLGKQQCSILLPVHHRLVQIKDLMMTQAGQIIFNNNNNNTTSSTTIGRGTPFQIQQQINYNQHTLNPYQQPMNYYAATNDLQINQNNNNFFNSHH